jgi:hypothetical protein
LQRCLQVGKRVLPGLAIIGACGRLVDVVARLAPYCRK